MSGYTSTNGTDRALHLLHLGGSVNSALLGLPGIDKLSKSGDFFFDGKNLRERRASDVTKFVSPRALGTERMVCALVASLALGNWKTSGWAICKAKHFWTRAMLDSTSALRRSSFASAVLPLLIMLKQYTRNNFGESVIAEIPSTLPGQELDTNGPASSDGSGFGPALLDSLAPGRVKPYAR